MHCIHVSVLVSFLTPLFQCLTGGCMCMCLFAAQPDELELREAMELAAIREFEAQKLRELQQEKEEESLRGGTEDGLDMTQAEVTIFTSRQRRQHFKTRIESLEKKLISLKVRVGVRV